jgi:RNA recognition motif-containing protein
VKECRLIRDYKRRSRGLCYLTLEDESSLEAALKHNDEVFMERKIRITKAKPVEEKKPKEEKEN